MATTVRAETAATAPKVPGRAAQASPEAALAASIDRRGRIGLWIGLALLLAAPLIGLYPVFMMKALCYAIFACAFNLLLGFTGLLSFGHAAFLGAAAYWTGWLVRTAGWSPELGVLAGAVGAALLGLIVGAIASVIIAK